MNHWKYTFPNTSHFYGEEVAKYVLISTSTINTIYSEGSGIINYAIYSLHISLLVSLTGRHVGCSMIYIP